MSAIENGKRKMPARSPASKTIYKGFRFTPDDWAEIERRAGARGITWTQYVTDSALDRLPEHVDAIGPELSAIKRRLERLEELAWGELS